MGTSSLPIGQLCPSSFLPAEQSKAAVRSGWEPAKQNYFSILSLSLSPSSPGCWQSITGTEAQLFSFRCVFSEPLPKGHPLGLGEQALAGPGSSSLHSEPGLTCPVLLSVCPPKENLMPSGLGHQLCSSAAVLLFPRDSLF